MSNAMRYWAMIAVLLAGIAGMGFLSHGESTPPARPLSDFPTDIGSYRTVKEFPFDAGDPESAGSDGLHEPGLFLADTGRLGTLYRLLPDAAYGRDDPFAKELPAGRRVAANRFGNHTS